MSEGLYDLELLLASDHFPHYRDWFIAPTFGRRVSYDKFSTTRFPLWNCDIRWLIVHSKGDTLVNFSQSRAIYAYLCRLYESDANTHVQQNMDQLQADHNDIPHGDDYADIVKNFVLRDALC